MLVDRAISVLSIIVLGSLAYVVLADASRAPALRSGSCRAPTEGAAGSAIGPVFEVAMAVSAARQGPVLEVGLGLARASRNGVDTGLRFSYRADWAVAAPMVPDSSHGAGGTNG